MGRPRRSRHARVRHDRGGGPHRPGARRCGAGFESSSLRQDPVGTWVRERRRHPSRHGLAVAPVGLRLAGRDVRRGQAPHRQHEPVGDQPRVFRPGGGRTQARFGRSRPFAALRGRAVECRRARILQLRHGEKLACRGRRGRCGPACRIQQPWAHLRRQARARCRGHGRGTHLRARRRVGIRAQYVQRHQHGRAVGRGRGGIADGGAAGIPEPARARARPAHGQRHPPAPLS